MKRQSRRRRSARSGPRPAAGQQSALDQFTREELWCALRDLQAAKAAGCPRYLVRSGQGKATLASGLHAAYPAAICRDLPEAAERIIHDFGLPHS